SSDLSIAAIDESKVPWLYITAKEDPHLTEITAEILEKSKSAEVLILPGSGHGSTLFNSRPELNERIAVWVEAKLK
ncbi:MAG: alpha/beta hydrolase, partial [Cyclobacteriaceae bacterium]